MNKKTLILAIMLMLGMLNFGNFGITPVSANEVKYWGVIVQGYFIADVRFLGDSQYVYHLMSDHYDFDGIYYLSINTTLPGVTNKTNIDNLNWSISDLAQKSDSNDVIWFWFATHGDGYNSKRDYSNDTGYQDRLKEMLDTDGDEGNETRESTLGFDINGDNATTDDWIGIDEVIHLNSSDISKSITDDWLNATLSTLSYGKLIVATSSCFGGGFVDNLSAPNRIIMTASNETDTGTLDYNFTTNLSPWARHFLDALHGEEVHWKLPGYRLVHVGVQYDADANSDGNVSLLEAWNYAWNNTSQRIGGSDTFWLDDNGNGLPNYWNETDDWTGYPSSIPCDNGTLADSTWFPRKYSNLTVETRLSSGQEVSNVSVWVDGSLAGNSSINVNVPVGYHEIKVEPLISYQNIDYRLTYWNTRAPYQNPTNIHPHENTTTVTAYYVKCNATRYMQNAKWDSTYWRMLWNNTSTYTLKTKTQHSVAYSAKLGVKIYKVNDTETLLTDDEPNDLLDVGTWYKDDNEIKSATWTCSEQNVTDSYIKVEVWYKFSSSSWAKLGVDFKTETFGQNTMLNATTWTVYLWGSLTYEFGPLGPWTPPGSSKATIGFYWGSSARPSRIEDMILFSPP